MAWDCAQRGHCWHMPDGSLYQRHSGHSPGDTADVVCCQCGTAKTLPLFGQSTAAPYGEDINEKGHGAHKPKEMKK